MFQIFLKLMPLTNCFVISFQAFDINYYINFERTAKIQEQKIIWELPQFINLRHEILTGPEGAFLMMLEASFEAKLILSDSSMTVNATDS